MVNISGGSYHEKLERMGDLPGDNLGKVTIFMNSGHKVVAESSDVDLLENHAVAARDINGRVWFAPQGAYVMADHAPEDDHQPVTDGGR